MRLIRIAGGRGSAGKRYGDGVAALTKAPLLIGP